MTYYEIVDKFSMRVTGVTQKLSKVNAAKCFVGVISSKEYLTYKAEPWHNPRSKKRFALEEKKVVKRRKLTKNEDDQFSY